MSTDCKRFVWMKLTGTETERTTGSMPGAKRAIADVDEVRI